MCVRPHTFYGRPGVKLWKPHTKLSARAAKRLRERFSFLHSCWVKFNWHICSALPFQDDAVPSVVDGVHIKMRLRKINEACTERNYIARRFCRTLPLVNVQSA